MKQIALQFAMDGAASRSIEDALKIIGDIADLVDIVEAGTSFVLRYGMESVLRFKEAFPDKQILADMKIMDGGYHHSNMGCISGADIITVLGVSDHETIRNATSAAHANGKEIMVDLICVADKAEVIAFCEEIGADYICVHAGVDVQPQGQSPYEDLRKVMALTRRCKVAVAGGIDEHTVEDICRLGPDVVIVGGAIHKSLDYRTVTECIRMGIDKISKEL
jgi:3-hexulose-6-phosphate synthase